MRGRMAHEPLRRPAPPVVRDVLASPGRPLDPALARMPSSVTLTRPAPRTWSGGLEIGSVFDPAEREADRASAPGSMSASPAWYDFSRVRIHTDSRAGESARAIHARAYTVGDHIVFSPGAFAPHTPAGQRLLTHELAHVVQQSGGTPVVQRDVSFDECSDDQETVVQESHDRAMEMVQNAISKLEAYDGTDPAEVRRAMRRHFHSTSTAMAWWLAGNLRFLASASSSPQYECQSQQDGSQRAWSAWCVPFTDILLYPIWFADTDIDARARTMIHEWVHRYGCNFDLGYEWEEGYEEHGTVRALLNADSWAHFVFDVR